MKKTLLLAYKDLAIYFRSPLAYVLMAFFLLASGYFFVVGVGFYEMLSMEAMRSPEVADFTLMELVVGPQLQNAGIILLFFLPLLTMRGFSEEKRMGTFEMLMSYPVREWEVAAGKLVALLGFLAAAIGVSALCSAGLLFMFSRPEIAPMLVGYLGLLLLALAFCSLGLFLSSLTENQVVAAVATFVALLLLWVLSWLKDAAPAGAKPVLANLSMLTHFEPFTKGVLGGSDVIFFVTFIAGFFWLTVLSLENQRWRA
ncbi:ABC transporter permease [Oceanidesulfovibrio marinus]|uniref:ABC transporter permease n=1 Tax=Oceanidesulfovibrio marinus TaxID=370038 RepID=A0A6P1ZDB7_9BACT|nr:ABC transporter permease [Oceanidesulfovibrio marinus]QJT10388.1 ABC transporter permease [Oceanidesulfovibrio marinus]TVM32336.1 ABC transporter permease [Oceanidesulfovibrio marinus]